MSKKYFEEIIGKYNEHWSFFPTIALKNSTFWVQDMALLLFIFYDFLYVQFLEQYFYGDKGKTILPSSRDTLHKFSVRLNGTTTKSQIMSGKILVSK